MSNPHFTALERLRQANVDAALAAGKKPAHGLTHTEIYRRWASMRSTCNRYRGNSQWALANRKGRSYCPEWEDFENFFDDMGPTYFPGAFLVRVDKAMGYSWSNCRWVTYEMRKKPVPKGAIRG